MDSAKNQIDTWDFSNDTITITGTGLSGSVLTTNTVDLSDVTPVTFSWNQSDMTTGIMAQDVSVVTGAYTYDNNTSWSPNVSLGQSGQISLSGENADIVVNGVSLLDKLDTIAERLNILDVNPELEEEWDQLRELGEQYRQLEQELKAKSEMWKTLKTKTPRKPRS